MRKCYYFFIIFLLCEVSCTQQKSDYYLDKIESILQINCPDNFKIIEHNEESAVGDYYEKFVLQFSVNDFNEILSQFDTNIVVKVKNKTGIYTINKGTINENFSSIIVDANKRTVQYTYREE